MMGIGLRNRLQKKGIESYIPKEEQQFTLTTRLMLPNHSYYQKQYIVFTKETRHLLISSECLFWCFTTNGDSVKEAFCVFE